jgi:hypothetical protein
MAASATACRVQRNRATPIMAASATACRVQRNRATPITAASAPACRVQQDGATPIGGHSTQAAPPLLACGSLANYRMACDFLADHGMATKPGSAEQESSMAKQMGAEYSFPASSKVVASWASCRAIPVHLAEQKTILRCPAFREPPSGGQDPSVADRRPPVCCRVYRGLEAKKTMAASTRPSRQRSACLPGASRRPRWPEAGASVRASEASAKSRTPRSGTRTSRRRG